MFFVTVLEMAFEIINLAEIIKQKEETCHKMTEMTFEMTRKQEYQAEYTIR